MTTLNATHTELQCQVVIKQHGQTMLADDVRTYHPVMLRVVQAKLVRVASKEVTVISSMSVAAVMSLYICTAQQACYGHCHNTATSASHAKRNRTYEELFSR